MRIISGAAECVCRCTTRGLTGSGRSYTALAASMLAVFDGMGGESCGEMAASAAVEALGGFYEENKKTLKKSLWFSDRSLRKYE